MIISFVLGLIIGAVVMSIGATGQYKKGYKDAMHEVYGCGKE